MKSFCSSRMEGSMKQIRFLNIIIYDICGVKQI